MLDNKLEGFKKGPGSRSAEAELDQLLEDSENDFLRQSVHADRMDAMSAQEALAYAQRLIGERLHRTSRVESSRAVDGVTMKDLDVVGLKQSMDSILAHAHELGRGGDGFVVVDINEIRALPPEVCYKFALTETVPRGRNGTFTELSLQDRFYETMTEHSGPIGVPEPFYAIEIGNRKMIAMEKLNAKSVDDILRGRGRIPEWIDTGKLIEDIRSALSFLHSKRLFHRDMHLGNVMISQSPTPEAKEAYIIDFGL